MRGGTLYGKRSVRALTCEKAKGWMSWTKFYSIYELSYRHSGTVERPFQLLSKNERPSRGRGWMSIFMPIAARDQSERSPLCYKNAVTYYAGGLTFRTGIAAHNLLLWEAMKWARQEGGNGSKWAVFSLSASG